jgi:hypothetical protein
MMEELSRVKEKLEAGEMQGFGRWNGTKTSTLRAL